MPEFEFVLLDHFCNSGSNKAAYRYGKDLLLWNPKVYIQVGNSKSVILKIRNRYFSIKLSCTNFFLAEQYIQCMHAGWVNELMVIFYVRFSIISRGPEASFYM